MKRSDGGVYNNQPGETLLLLTSPWRSERKSMHGPETNDLAPLGGLLLNLFWVAWATSVLAMAGKCALGEHQL